MNKESILEKYLEKRRLAKLSNMRVHVSEYTKQPNAFDEATSRSLGTV